MRISSLLPSRARAEPASAAPTATSGEPAQLRITDVSELGDLLDQLIDHHLPVTLATPDGQSYTTRLVGCEPQARRICFAASSRDMRLRGLIDANEALAVAYLDQVRLQFDLHGLMLVHGAKESVLQAEWPLAMLRFQRRDSYRVRPLDHRMPAANLIHPSGACDHLSLRIIDLSLGGLALQLPADKAPIEPGMTLDPVEIELDALTCLDVALRVVHVSVLDGGRLGTRLGCEWSRLGGAATRALQRHVESTQRRQRRMLATGALR
jgi:c-di-GMP-binding flagellar brake protein YcgR